MRAGTCSVALRRQARVLINMVDETPKKWQIWWLPQKPAVSNFSKGAEFTEAVLGALGAFPYVLQAILAASICAASQASCMDELMFSSVRPTRADWFVRGGRSQVCQGGRCFSWLAASRNQDSARPDD